MTTTDAVLRRAIEGGGAERILTLDPAFQGLPDTAHGGSVLAAFDALADVKGPRELVGHYRKRVPLGVPLRLVLAHEGTALTCRLCDDTGTALVDGRVRTTGGDASAADGGGGLSAGGPGARHVRPVASGLRGRPGVEQPSPVVGGVVERASPPGPRADQTASSAAVRVGDGEPLPVSRTCFACGVDNPLGLRVRLAFNAERVWGTWEPRETLRGDDGAFAPIAVTTLLDEAAFWLGALATGESGMTTELAVTLRGALPREGALTVSGTRASVRPRPHDSRYWDTEVAARDAAGSLVATATITFVTIRGAARRLVTGILAMNPPEIVRRVFPAYAR